MRERERPTTNNENLCFARMKEEGKTGGNAGVVFPYLSAMDEAKSGKCFVIIFCASIM